MSGGEDNVVYVWSFAKLVSGHGTAPLYSFSHHSMPVKALYCGYGGSKARLFTAGLDNACNVYDLCTGTLLLTIALPSPITKLVINPTETVLYALSVSNEIFKISLTEKPEDNVIEAMAPFIKSLSKLTTFTLSDTVLLVGVSNGSVVQYDVLTGQALPDVVCQHQELVKDVLSVQCTQYLRSVKHVPWPYTNVLARRPGVEVEESVVVLGRRGKGEKSSDVAGRRKGERSSDVAWLSLVTGCCEEEGLSSQKENLSKMECLSAKLLEVVTNKVLSDV